MAPGAPSASELAAEAELDQPLLGDVEELVEQEQQQQVAGGFRQWWARDHSDNPLMCAARAASRGRARSAVTRAARPFAAASMASARACVALPRRPQPAPPTPAPHPAAPSCRTAVVSAARSARGGRRGRAAARADAPARSYTSGFIFGQELGERLCYYAISSNLVTYLKSRMRYSDAEASQATTTFSGSCYGTAIIGAVVADLWLGRFWTVILFSCCYQVGMVMLCLSPSFSPALGLDGRAATDSTLPQEALLWTALYLIALGTGGIKPNVSTFGADQFEKGNAKHEKLKGSYWSYLYVTVNIGSLIATTAVVAVQEHGWWTAGFVIPCSTLGFSILAFGSGYRRYRHQFPQRAAVDPLAPRLDPIASARAFCVLHEAKMRMLAAAVPFMVMDGIFWSAYMQLPSTFVLQGELMDRKVAGFTIPAASMTAFDIGSVLLFIPFFDAVVYPRVRRLGFATRPVRRIAGGYVFAIASMCAAALCEHYRLRCVNNGAVLPLAEGAEPDDPLVAKMSMMWQIPQYVFVGGAEAMTAVAESEFFYSFATPELRSVCMAMRLGATALGGYFASGEVELIKSVTRNPPWIPKEEGKSFNDGRVDLFYVFLACLLVANLGLFVTVARHSSLTVVPPDEGAASSLDAEVAEGEGGEEGGKAALQASAPAGLPDTAALTVKVRSMLDDVDEATRRAVLTSLLAAKPELKQR